MSGLVFAAGLTALLLLLGGTAAQGLAWLLKGLLAAAGYGLSLLALALWALLHPGEAARLWREAGRRHASG